MPERRPDPDPDPDPDSDPDPDPDPGVATSSTASPWMARPGPANNSGTRNVNGFDERGAHCFTYAICTPVVESTRSAASISEVNRIGKRGDPAYSESMASRTASIRAALCGWKKRA